MPALRQPLLLDLWSPLGHKAAMEDPRQARLATSWMGDEHLRRITAYHLLDAYLENAAREHLRSADNADRAGHREYGDVDAFVGRVVAGVLGDEITIAVDGADTDVPDAPQLPDEPTAPADDADETTRRIHALQQERWAVQVGQVVDEWERAWRDQPGLQDVQDRLRSWADDEQLESKLRVAERDANGLGDGVLVLGWDAEKRRPTLQVYDPRWYFPVLDDDAFRRGYPSKVHLAWEEERTVAGQKQQWVRRITYELVQLDEPRRYPWAPDVDSWFTCVLTDAEWKLSDSSTGWEIDAVAPSKATYRRTPPTVENPEGDEVNRLDLRIDFLPVLHVPGIPSGREHYGRSILSRVLQIFDDLQANDSDLQAAAALAGTPMVGLSGKAAVGTTLEVAPGAVFSLGEGGRMDVVDLSASVDALRHVVDDLLERLSVNIQIPGEVLGRVDDTGPESGFARLLKLGPFSSLIGMLRLVRVNKYRLLLKFVQRMYQADGTWEPGETVDARIVFGPFLPTDQASVVELVTSLWQADGLSIETGLRMLVEAGVPIDDIADEVRRIEARDFEGADKLLTATGLEDAVFTYLGLDPDLARRPEPPPEIDLPQGGA